MRLISSLSFAALSLISAAPLLQISAQTVREAFPLVHSIQTKFEGFRAASDQFIFSNIQLRAGMTYNPALIDQSIRALYETGQFEFVEVDVLDAADRQLDVIFKFVSKYKIEQIRFSGSESYSADRLSSKAELETGLPLDEYAVSVAADKIAAYYVEKGYPDAAVDYRIQRDADLGLATVTFDVVEGTKIRIEIIRFSGNESFSNGKLRKLLETKKRGFWSWLTGSGKLDEQELKTDLERLRAFYRDQGFLDILIESDQVEIEFVESDRIAIKLSLTEGRRYFLGELKIEDATIFTSQELLSQLSIRSGDSFSPTETDEAVAAIRNYYGSRGYLDTSVRAERVPNLETGSIDLVFRVRESEKFYVESINIEGNTKTKAKVIIRELALRPGDVFDSRRMQVSQSRLQNTSFFEEVRLAPEDTLVPARKDLGVIIREGRTGSFTFGAGFGSVEKAVIFFEMSQGNFDIFNWRSGFQGDGQKFRFKVSLGTKSNQLTIAFEEPWLFEQRLAFGVELFRSESDYNSADYNELRTGFELYLRRRIFELVEARLSYRLELVEILDVARPNGGSGIESGDGVANVFQAAEGEELVSKFGLTLLRDNRDSLIFTRKGNRTSILNELAGWGGDVNYFKTEVRTAHFIPTFEHLEQTFSVVARLGAAAPFGDSADIPFYDRFYLGGPETLRGFDFRDVGPRDSDDTDESIGGNTYSLVSLEYGFRIAEPLGLVVFYDWGFVNSDEYDFSFSNYADNWGVGARVMLMGSPLKLDLGIPITSPDGESGGTQFNFSFGTRF
jgi:outer membrane protein insertion porin family